MCSFHTEVHWHSICILFFLSFFSQYIFRVACYVRQFTIHYPRLIMCITLLFVALFRCCCCCCCFGLLFNYYFCFIFGSFFYRLLPLPFFGFFILQFVVLFVRSFHAYVCVLVDGFAMRLIILPSKKTTTNWVRVDFVVCIVDKTK